MMPLASARSAQEGGTGASQNPRRGGSLMLRNYRRAGKRGALAPASVDVVGETDHQSVLDVVEGFHPIGDGDVGRIALAQGVFLSADEGGHPVAKLDGNELLISEVEHLELVEHVVDVADL